MSPSCLMIMCILMFLKAPIDRHQQASSIDRHQQVSSIDHTCCRIISISIWQTLPSSPPPRWCRPAWCAWCTMLSILKSSKTSKPSMSLSSNNPHLDKYQVKWIWSFLIISSLIGSVILLHLLHNDVDLHGDDVTMLMLGTVSKHLSVYFRDIQIVIQFES